VLQELDFGWFRTTVDTLVRHVRKITEGGPARELTLLGFNNVAEFLLECHIWRAAHIRFRGSSHEGDTDNGKGKGKGKERSASREERASTAPGKPSYEDSIDGGGGRNATYIAYLADLTREGFVAVRKALALLCDHKPEGRPLVSRASTPDEERRRTTKKRYRHIPSPTHFPLL
jgi:hypothetical protein